jgi:hypothetical protein
MALDSQTVEIIGPLDAVDGPVDDAAAEHAGHDAAVELALAGGVLK